MNIIFICIIAILAAIAITDYKKRIIPNYYLAGLIALGIINKYLKYGYLNVFLSLWGMIMVFFLCAAIGYVYLINKKIDIAGGGDYKLIAVLGFLIGIKELLVCLILEVIFEFIYRYIVFPERKNKALPLGASLGVFSIVVLIIGGMW